MEHKYDLISLPFAFFWQLTMLMLPLFLIIKQFRASAVTASILPSPSPACISSGTGSFLRMRDTYFLSVREP